jgi:hypothetical protein
VIHVRSRLGKEDHSAEIARVRDELSKMAQDCRVAYAAMIATPSTVLATIQAIEGSSVYKQTRDAAGTD